MSDRAGDDLDAFWFMGDDVVSAENASDDSAPDALARHGRPDITLRGRNLAEVLRPAYDRLKED